MKALQSQGSPFDLSKALPPSECHSEGLVAAFAGHVGPSGNPACFTTSHWDSLG